MVIVDSSVWINYFNSVDNEETKRLIFLLKVTQVATGDLIILEVLRGFRQDKDYETASELLLALPFFTLVDKRLALSAARNYRYLRKESQSERVQTLLLRRFVLRMTLYCCTQTEIFCRLKRTLV